MFLTSTLTPPLARLTDRLYEIGAIQFNFNPDPSKRFPLKVHDDHPDWPKSPVYISLRDETHPDPAKRGKLDPVTWTMIGDALHPLLLAQREATGFDFIVDIPDAGTPFGDQAMRVLRLSDAHRLWLTKIKRDDGTRYIGPLKEIKEPYKGSVILIDDLVTAAGTKLEAIAQLEAAGYRVVLVLVLIDREAGGIEQLRARNVNIVAAMKVSDMLRRLVDTGVLTREKEEEILAYPLEIKRLQNAA